MINPNYSSVRRAVDGFPDEASHEMLSARRVRISEKAAGVFVVRPAVSVALAAATFVLGTIVTRCQLRNRTEPCRWRRS